MKIIYQTETGISIIHPTGEVPIETVFAKDVPAQYKATAKIVDDNVIPTDRIFRDAWEFDGNVITESLNKSKEIHKDRLRQQRKPMLEELDAKFMQALEKGEDTKAIVVEKQKLRDITKYVDACEDTIAIRQVIL